MLTRRSRLAVHERQAGRVPALAAEAGVVYELAAHVYGRHDRPALADGLPGLVQHAGGTSYPEHFVTISASPSVAQGRQQAHSFACAAMQPRHLQNRQASP